MRSIGSFLICMLPYMLAAIPLYVAARVLFLKRENRLGERNYWREGALFAYAVFLAGLASQTVFPGVLIEPEGGISLHAYGAGGINLVPFTVLQETYREFTEGNANYFVINFLGNIVMFMPIGFCQSLFWAKASFRKAALTGCIASLCIELCQLPLLRGADIDDIWLNTLGAVLGYGVYRLLLRAFPKYTERFRYAGQAAVPREKISKGK